MSHIIWLSKLSLHDSLLMQHKQEQFLSCINFFASNDNRRNKTSGQNDQVDLNEQDPCWNISDRAKNKIRSWSIDTICTFKNLWFTYYAVKFHTFRKFYFIKIIFEYIFYSERNVRTWNILTEAIFSFPIKFAVEIVLIVIVISLVNHNAINNHLKIKINV